MKQERSQAVAGPNEPAQEFRSEALAPRVGLVREFWDFVKHNKKWWLIPILVVMLLLGLLLVLGGTGLGPFMYSFF